MDSDYDEVSAPSEYFATDEKGDAPFENGINRVDNMQGTYHDYAGGGWIEMKVLLGCIARRMVAAAAAAAAAAVGDAVAVG